MDFSGTPELSLANFLAMVKKMNTRNWQTIRQKILTPDMAQVGNRT